MSSVIKGTLPIGVDVDGVLHRDFELRGATVLDNIQVTEEMVERDEQVNPLRVATAMMARQLIQLGTLRRDQITTDLVRAMHIADWNHLDKESAGLEKKLLGAVETLPATGGSASSPGAPDTTLTPATSTT